MCRLLLASLCCLCFTWTIYSAEIKLPAEIKVAPGELVEIVATGDGITSIAWVSPDAGLSIIPAKKLKDPLTTFAVAVKPGTYRVIAVGVGEDGLTSPVTVSILCTGSGPVVPPETDPLLGKLQAAYTSDTSADKSKHLTNLVSLYKLAGPFAAKPEITTVGELARKIKEASGTLVPGNALIGIRRTLAEELGKVLPDQEDAALTAELRSKAAETFSRFEALLRAVK